MISCFSNLFYCIKRDAPLIAILVWFLSSVAMIGAGLVCSVVFTQPLWLVVAGVGCLVNPFTVLWLLVRFYMLQSKYGEWKKEQTNISIITIEQSSNNKNKQEGN